MSAPGSVSVVIPTYNRAALVTRAVASALAQCRAGDEVVVIDDGSTDDTAQRLKPWSDRIVYRKTVNGGAGRARNAGLDRAGREYVAFLDSDDEWLPGKLDLQRGLLDARPDVVSCFTDMRALYPSGAVRHRLTRHYAGRDFTVDFLGPKTPYSALAALPSGVRDFPVHIGDLYAAQLEHEYVQIGTLMFRRSALADRTVRFPEDIRVSEDAEFVARLAARGPAAYLDVETEVFHHHDGERLTDLGSFAFVDARLRLLERVWGADRDFLARHGDRYRAASDRLHLLRARILLGHGRPAEARAEVALAGSAPAYYRLLCSLPPSLLVWAARLRGLRRG